jgi:isoleucyl-tRNA synthetase
MYQEVPTSLDFPKLEHEVFAFWEEQKIFDRLREKNRGKPRWSFIDGPITANNPMGVHHAWGRTYKDIYQRYQAMTGHELRYQNGFDCQGLWVEVEVEKELRQESKRRIEAGADPKDVPLFESKKDIERYGIDRFVEKCKERVRRCAAIQTEQSKRLGYWMDWNNSYYTMSDENNYMIWHFLRTCHDRGWVYKGVDVMPWCPRCGTGISEHEMNEGYADVEHTAVFLRFPLADRANESFLVWTTTPWTLTSNVALAVHPELAYVKVAEGEEILYLAKGCLKVLKDKKAKVLEEFPGQHLVGLRYSGPFDGLPAVARDLARSPAAHRVIPWKEVSEAEGTGVVHIAPGCGKEDFALGKEHGLPAIAPIDEEGVYLDGFGAYARKFAGGVAEQVLDDLQSSGRRYKKERYRHRYPHCWRCRTELLFRLVDEWFIAMDPWRERIMDVTRQIAWIPSYGLERELDWLRNMHDWMVSKKRFWGLALPIWECRDCGAFTVIGGREELEEKAVEGWEDFEGRSPHRPWIDKVKIACPSCGKAISRVKDVGNPWLDAGIVPFSTLDYRTRRDYWRQWFPADFVTECFPGQFRNWFYSLLAMSTALENKPPFKTLLGHALVRDENGKEMHKSLGNAIEFNTAAEEIGADVMRWLFAGQNPVNNLNFGYGPAADVRRRLLTLWNTYAFFVTYARIDAFDPRRDPVPLGKRSALDRWIIASLQKLIESAHQAYSSYNVMQLVKEVERFVDRLSNWYLRRSRERFWREGDDADKRAAFQTLHQALVALVETIAPILPFLSESMYRNLVVSLDAAAPPSVHLVDFPRADARLVDEELLRQMDVVVRIVELGRSIRKDRKLRVRQPLQRLSVSVRRPEEKAWLEPFKDQILDELNVKELVFIDDPSALASFQVKPNFRLLGPRFGSRMPEIVRALAQRLPRELAAQARAGEDIVLKLGADEASLAPEELDVQMQAAAGLAVAEDGGYLAALSTEVTPQLLHEGIARDISRALNKLRRDAGYHVADRIRVEWSSSSPEAAAAIAEHAEFIKSEALAAELARVDRPTGDAVSDLDLDLEDDAGAGATLGVRKLKGA